MRVLLISILVLFAMQSKADNNLTEVRVDSIVYVGHDNGLTEVRVDGIVYVGTVVIVDNTVYIEPVNVIQVERNNSTVIYVNSSATTLKYVVVEPKISVDYSIVKLNKK